MIAVLAELAVGEVQYKELLAMVNEAETRPGNGADVRPLSDQSLTQTLKRAVEHGLVIRREEPGQIKKTFYRLTAKGESGLLSTRSLIQWAQEFDEDEADEESA